jgi:hypothetical protein
MSCSLIRIRGLLRARVTDESHRPFYRSFEVTPSISLLSSQGDGVINTADIERRNATFRERLAPLARRCRALARQTLTLEHGMYLIGTVSNFCTSHARLRLAAQATGTGALNRTPAMAAGITDHCWTVRELLAFHMPPPRWAPPKQRGRPSRALQRLIERWCS